MLLATFPSLGYSVIAENSREICLDFQVGRMYDLLENFENFFLGIDIWIEGEEIVV
jgi:hypothetical protein